jgi:predicted DNA-binding transcriptional regulator YafY
VVAPRGRHSEIIRQWNLLRDVEASRFGKSLPELAAATGVSTRTIRRDLEALEQAGFAFEKVTRDGTPRWKLDRALYKPLVEAGLNLPEVCALYFSRTLLTCLAGTPFHGDLASAFEKLEQAIAPGIREYLDRLPDILTAKAEPVKKRDERQAPVIAKLVTATLEHRRISVDYHSFRSGREKQYVLEPYRLAYAEGGIYLLAFVPAYNQVRTFAVERIRKLTMLEERFTPAQQLPAEPFGDSMGVFTGQPEPVTVAFSGEAARHVRERQWHASQTLETRSDGTTVLKMTVCIDFALQAWILSFGSQARVLQPSELAERILEQIEESRELYQPRIPFDAPPPRPEAAGTRAQRRLPMSPKPAAPRASANAVRAS